MDPNPPEEGEAWPDIFRDVENVIMPGVRRCRDLSKVHTSN